MKNLFIGPSEKDLLTSNRRNLMKKYIASLITNEDNTNVFDTDSFEEAWKYLCQNSENKTLIQGVVMKRNEDPIIKNGYEEIWSTIAVMRKIK